MGGPARTMPGKGQGLLAPTPAAPVTGVDHRIDTSPGIAVPRLDDSDRRDPDQPLTPFDPNTPLSPPTDEPATLPIGPVTDWGSDHHFGGHYNPWYPRHHYPYGGRFGFGSCRNGSLFGFQSYAFSFLFPFGHCSYFGSFGHYGYSPYSGYPPYAFWGYGGGGTSRYSYLKADTGPSRDLVESSLQQAQEETRELGRQAGILSELVSEYRGGSLSRDAFAELVTLRAERIRRGAREIRKDRVLTDYDQNDRGEISPYSRTKTLEGFSGLLEILNDTISRLDQRLAEEFANSDQVVSSSSLQGPAFHTLCRQIEELTKTIKRSVKDL